MSGHQPPTSPEPNNPRQPSRLPSKSGHGRKAITGSPRRKQALPKQPPDPVKVGKIVAECLEVTPRILNPLQVRTGARDWHTVMTLFGEVTAAIDVLNTEDGHEYHILVVRKSSNSS